jgi:hypothetical protein
MYILLFHLAYSPNMPRVSLGLLHVRIDSFCVFGDNSVYRKQPYIRSYSPYTLKYIPRILYGCLNTFRAFSEYAERMKNTRKETFTFKKTWGLERDSI